MSYQQVIFATGEYYHIFNRGVEKREIFTTKRHYHRFTETLVYYQKGHPLIRFSFKKRERLAKETKVSPSPLVAIICFVFMPTHFHLLVQQLQDNGISMLLSKLSNSYTKYFNIKYNRVGPLFQGSFKAIRVEDDEQLVHLSRYIHLNPFVGLLVKDLRNYPYSSYPEYLGVSEASICEKNPVLSHFRSVEDYEKFVLDQASYAKQIKSMERLLLDDF